VQFDELAEEMISLKEVAADKVHVATPEEGLVGLGAENVVGVNQFQGLGRPAFLDEQRPSVVPRVRPAWSPV
jgi:hypothetical protein